MHISLHGGKGFANLTRRRRPSSASVLLVAGFGAFLAFLDSTIVNIAFPDIQRSFPSYDIGSLSWILNGYNIVFAAFMVAAGRLADLLGRRRTFLSGVLVFTIASGLCAVAGSVEQLVAFRVLQGIGAAILVPASLALVVEGFDAAGLVGMCSFQLGGTKRGPIPSYDAAQALRADAKTLGFPIRLPQLPGGWTPNSGGRGGIENGRADPATGQRRNAATSIVGFISPTGRYLSLTQSNADEDKLVGSIHPSMYPTGTVDVGGTRWVVYEGSDENGAVEPVWTTRLTGPGGATQLAITGAGSIDQFRTLASATQSQPPLPAR